MLIKNSFRSIQLIKQTVNCVNREFLAITEAIISRHSVLYALSAKSTQIHFTSVSKIAHKLKTNINK